MVKKKKPKSTTSARVSEILEEPQPGVPDETLDETPQVAKAKVSVEIEEPDETPLETPSDTAKVFPETDDYTLALSGPAVFQNSFKENLKKKLLCT